MANVKISQLPDASSIDGTEYVEIVQGGVNKKVQISEFPFSSPSSHPFTVTGTTVTLADSNPTNAEYYLNGLRCEVGGTQPWDILSIVGTTVTFNEDRTGDRFIAIY